MAYTLHAANRPPRHFARLHRAVLAGLRLRCAWQVHTKPTVSYLTPELVEWHDRFGTAAMWAAHVAWLRENLS